MFSQPTEPPETIRYWIDRAKRAEEALEQIRIISRPPTHDGPVHQWISYSPSQRLHDIHQEARWVLTGDASPKIGHDYKHPDHDGPCTACGQPKDEHVRAGGEGE